MLAIRIAAVGRMRGDPTAGLTDDYLTRARDIGRGLGLAGPALSEVEAPRGLMGEARQAREAALLMAAAGPSGPVILLDEGGTQQPSRRLASMMGRWRDAGEPAVSFVIGGADGLDPTLAQTLGPRLAGTLAFGPQTWPHMLVRVMLAEQIYRAMTILAGHPYHRD